MIGQSLIWYKIWAKTLGNPTTANVREIVLAFANRKTAYNWLFLASLSLAYSYLYQFGLLVSPVEASVNNLYPKIVYVGNLLGQGLVLGLAILLGSVLFTFYLHTLLYFFQKRGSFTQLIYGLSAFITPLGISFALINAIPAKFLVILFFCIWFNPLFHNHKSYLRKSAC